MKKVDLEFVREIRDRITVIEKEARRLWHELAALPGFCQDCGRTDVEFYPLQTSGPDSLSPYLCVECEKKRREG